MSDALIPVTREQLISLLAYGLLFDPRGKSHRHAHDSMAMIAAETLARHLEQSGYVVLKRQPAEPPRTPKG